MSELKLQQCRLDGRYDVLECLGRGSYAEVYLARDAAATGAAPHMVVIKALNLSLQGALDVELEHTLIENFRNEAVALDRVRHPNIISRLGHGTAIDLSGRAFHYLVLEYLSGGDMAALCRHHPLSLERTLFYLKQVCAGLEHAHENSVIHRDIKPQNLLLTADQQTVKIADFGVAKIEATEGSITRVGTDVYAAPEHHPLAQTGPLETTSLTRPPKHLTPAADVYSLAKTTYMLLTGEAPRRFSQMPILDFPSRFAAQPWASFVLRVLHRATETNPLERYQTVREFWEEMRDAILPQTKLLVPSKGASAHSVPSGGTSRDYPKVSAGPPPPPFLPSNLSQVAIDSSAHPRIVVPLAASARQGLEHAPKQTPRARTIADVAPKAIPARSALSQRRPLLSSRLRRWLVALLLITAFAGMLLATHTYVRKLRSATTPASATSVPNPPRNAPNAPKSGANTPRNSVSAVGREFVTSTDVNLRSGPDKSSPKVGLAENGSRVRVLTVNGKWYEVMVLEHSGEKREPNSSDQGWVNSNYLTLK